MKKNILKLLFKVIISALSISNYAYAQESYDNTNTPRQYYYNNLEGATVGTTGTYMPNANFSVSSPSSIYLKASSTLNGTKSYSATGTGAIGTIGYLKWNFMGGTNTANLGNYNFEWEFDYQSTTTTAAADATITMPNADASDGSKDSWRYWLIANTYGSGANNMSGLFVTITNGTLKLFTRINQFDYTDNGAGISLGNNTNKYQIRIVRNTIGYYYIFVYNKTANTTNAYGPYNVGTNRSGVDFATYNYSYLEVSSYSADRFQFDNFNFYQQKVDYVGITSASNGITTNIYPGIVDAIPYGVNVNIRGDIMIGRLRFLANANAQALFADNSGALYKTTNSVLAKGTATQILSGVGIYNDGSAQMNLPSSEYYYSPGTTTGATVNVINYFLLAQGRNPFYSPAPTSISFSVSPSADDNYQNFYQSTFPYSGGSGSTGGTVTIATPPTISYSNQTYTAGVAIATLTPTTSGSITSYSTTGLPAGLSLNTSTGAIIGTPTTVGNANYSVTATGAAGSATSTFNIIVNVGTPTVTTAAVTSIYGGSAVVGGSITAINGANVTEYGVVFSTSTNPPTTSSTKVILGTSATGATTFSTTLEGLAANTTYYVRAYAINSAGTAYGGTTSTTFTTLAAPNISYTTSTYTTGTAMSVTPANTGGAVPATTYLSSTTLYSGGGTSNPYNVAFDNNGYFYVVDGLANKVLKVPVGGGTATQLGPTYTLNTIAGIAVDALGNVYVSDQINGTIYKTTPAGTRSVYITGLSGPSALVFDASQNLYIAEYTGNRVDKVSYGSTTPVQYSSTTLTGAYGLAFDPTGALYVAERNDLAPTSGFLYKIPAGGGAATRFGTVATNMRNIDVDAAGNVYAVDFTNSKIIKITSAGVATDFITGLSSPRGVALDAAGNLFLSESGAGTVKKLLLGGYTISPTSLPAGLSFNGTTGTVSGTPTGVTSGTTFTVTAYNSGGNSSASITIVINPSAPTVSPIAQCGAGNASLTASGSLPSGGTYNWYATSSSTTVLKSTAAYNPFIGGTTTLYVSYTASGVTSARTPVTITVTPQIGSSVSTPVISWPLDGSTISDVSGYGNTGLKQNSPTLTTDRNGNVNSAYTFNGTNTYIVASNIQNPNPVVFSVSIWFKTTSALGGTIASMGGNQITATNATHDHQLWINTSGVVGFGVYNGGIQSVTTGTTAYNDGLWHHAVVTVGKTNGMKIYMDGTLAGTNATYTVPQQTGGYWRLGGEANGGFYTGADYYTGDLDEFILYDHELTATEAAGNDLNQFTFTGNYCASNPVTITAPVLAGATYAWVDNSNPAYTASTSTATFASATTSSYKLTVTNGSCTSVSTITPVTPTYTWTGALGTTAQNAAGNWYSNIGALSAPTFTSGNESIIIPAGLSVYPVLSGTAQTYSVYSLTVASGATLSLGDNNTLNVGCNLYNNANTANGIISTDVTKSTINFNGSLATQSYIGTNTTYPVQVGNVTIANTNASTGTINISGGKIDVYRALTLTSGKLVVASSTTVTLKSTATLTASIPAVTSPSTITGDIVAERYFSGGSRGYRLISSPVATTSLLNTPSSGINSFNLKEVIKNVYITGPGTVSGSPVLGTTVNSNGFDYSANNNPSIFIYKESDPSPANINIAISDYKGFASINEYVPMGNGILMFYRGDRTLNQAGATAGNAFASPYPTPNASTVSFKGTVITGDVAVYLPNFKTTASYYNVLGAASGLSAGTTTLNSTPFTTAFSYTAANSGNKNGMNLVGNPYPSTIDLEQVSFGGGAASYASGKVAIYTLNKGGAYSLYLRAAAPGSVGTASGTSANLGSRYILSGQGFFVKSISSNATVTFKESSKVVYPTGTTGSVTGVPTVYSLANPNSLVKIRLIQDTTLFNETLLAFNKQYKDSYDITEDLPYITGPTQTLFLYSVADENPLIYNQMGALEQVKKPIKLFVQGAASGIYKFEFEPNTVDPYYRIFLKDKYTKDSLEITVNKTYTFNINKADTATFGANRFTLVVHKVTLGEYQLIKFTGVKPANSTAVNLSWETKNESDVVTFEIERSTDGGTTFTSLGVVQSSSKGTYTFTDISPSAVATNVYRLKQADVNDAISYSDLVTITTARLTGSSDAITVFPNPTTTNITVKVTQKVNGPVELHVVNLNGKIVKNVNFGQAQQFEQNVSDLMPGTYVVDIFETATKRKVATTKFVKL